MASAMELMWPGVPVTACATMKPRRSKTPAERSPASRTIEVNDVRMSAAACSLTTPTSRLQQMSRVTGSIMSSRRCVAAHVRRRATHGGLVEGHDRTRLLHPLRVGGERGLALGLREVPACDHLAAAALDHHAPHAGHAEEVGLARADRGDLGRHAGVDEAGRRRERGQAPGDGIVEASRRAPAEERASRSASSRGRLALHSATVWS